MSPDLRARLERLRLAGWSVRETHFDAGPRLWVLDREGRGFSMPPDDEGWIHYLLDKMDAPA